MSSAVSAKSDSWRRYSAWQPQHMPSRYALCLPQAQQNFGSVVVVIENAPEDC